MVKRELSDLKSIAKGIVQKKTFVKIGKIKDDLEKIQLYKYSIKSAFELILHEFEIEFKKHRKTKDLFHLEIEVSLLKNKINYFYVNYDKKDFKQILLKVKEIKRGIKEL